MIRKKGFFLQVEGASIDKRAHAADPCGQIGETIAFDDAIRSGLEFARANSDTLVIVTADHAHVSQIIPTVRGNPADRRGMFSQLITKDGVPMTVSYGSGPPGTGTEHTGTQVRILSGTKRGTSDGTDGSDGTLSHHGTGPRN